MSDQGRRARVLEPEPGERWTIELRDDDGVQAVHVDDEERAHAVAVGWLAGAELDELVLAGACAHRHRGRRSSMR